MNVGQKIPYNGGSNATATGTISVNVSYTNVGVNLQVTPKIMPDGKVLMRVIPEVSSLVPQQVPLGNGQTAAAFNLQHFETTVAAMDGETIVMGGMIQKTTNDNESKVPFMGDLPGIGWLFRYTTKTVAKTELLVILTPHVVRSREDAARLLADESKRIELGSARPVQDSWRKRHGAGAAGVRRAGPAQHAVAAGTAGPDAAARRSPAAAGADTDAAAGQLRCGHLQQHGPSGSVARGPRRPSVDQCLAAWRLGASAKPQAATKGVETMQGCKWLLWGVCLFIGAGCFSLDKVAGDKPPQGPVAQVQTWWRSELAATQNKFANGETLPGIAGRVYLFSGDLAKDGRPVEAHGNCKLVVEMKYIASNKQPVTIRWDFAKKTHLDKVLRKDRLGWGYTIFLPWAEYDPGVPFANITLAFIQENGEAIYATPTRLRLQQQATPVQATTQTKVLTNSGPQGAQGLATGKLGN